MTERWVLVDARALQGSAGTPYWRLLLAGRAALPGVRWAGLIDPAGPGLQPGRFDAVFSNAYAAGTPACFVRLQPGGGDHLFAARLLLRDDVPSVAVDPVVPEGRLERELAAYWLRRSTVTTRDRLWTDVAGLICAREKQAVQRMAVFTTDAEGALARASGAPIFGAETVPLLSPRFGRTVFIIGNSAADGALITLLRRFGGDVVLTTSCLMAAYGSERATALAEAELGRAVPAGEMAQWREGIARPAALLLGEVAAAARALSVPSAWLAEEVATRYGRRATVLPLAAAATADGRGIVAVAAGLQAEACVWALELLRFWGAEVPLSLDCPEAERAGLAALAGRLGIGGLIGFGSGAGEVTVVLAMRGGEGREAALVAAAAAGNCVASRCLVETVGAPPWVWTVPDQPSPPLLAATIRAALDARAPDAAAWALRHDPAAVAALLA